MTQKNNLGSNETNVSLASAKRMQMFNELYELLHVGFGKTIASKISANVVNTLDTARAVLVETVSR